MSAPTPKQLLLRDAAQIEMLASPVRAELLLTLANQGAMSAQQVATHLGRDARSLHYHLRKLVDAGLIRQCGKQSVGPRSEALFEAVATQFRVDRSATSPTIRAAMLKSVRTGLRLAEREYEAGLGDSAYATGDRREQLEFMQQDVRLPKAQIKAVRQLLDEARRLAREHHNPDRGEWVTFTTVITPGAGRKGKG